MEEDELKKEINQEERVEPVVQALSGMGDVWKKITTKFANDKVCYLSGKVLKDDDKFHIVKVPDEKVDKGLIAFVCIAASENVDEGEQEQND